MDDDLYEAYVDRVLSGTAEAPDAFLAAHPEAGPELRARLVALHRMIAANDVAARRPHSGGAVPSATPAMARTLRAPGAPHARDETTEADGISDGVAAAAAGQIAAPGLPFERLGGYRLVRRIGSGGMGDVYLATDEALGRPVALKLLRPELERSPEAAERFRREAQAVARLRHPGIVTLYGAGEDGGVRYLAMEFVPGRGLDEMTVASPGGRVPASSAVPWAAQVARALAHAHAAGIVHRDVKPSNVRITPEGRALLLDFGIARDLAVGAPTMTGPFIGSPIYAAPEQVAGRPVDARADVYGVGATLYELLAGAPPHEPTTMEDAIRRILDEDPEPLRRRNPEVSRDLAIVVAKAMEKDPERRYASAADLADDLDAVLAFRPIRARPPGPLRRASHWARRNAAVAAALATTAVGAIVISAVLVVREVESARALRVEAAGCIAEAARRVGEFRDLRNGVRDAEKLQDDLEQSLQTRYLSSDESRHADRARRDLADSRRRRESLFHDALDLLNRAERLGADTAEADAVRADLYMERWQEARVVRDRVSESFYRGLVIEHDAARRHADALAARGTLDLVTSPAGAAVRLFRYEEHAAVAEGGDSRLVPVPFQDARPATAPGTVALEVTGGPACGDVLLAIGGRAIAEMRPAEARALAAQGGSVRRWRDGVVEDAVLPPATPARVTAAPLLTSPACEVGTTPLEGFVLPEGSYVALLRRDGFETQRATLFVIAGRSTRVEVDLVPLGTSPPGFVHVLGDDRPRPHDFWVQEREVTSAEYLAYLNDREIRAAARDPGAPHRFPRSAPARGGDPHWTRDADGAWSLPADWPSEFPVVGVSHDDAVAYAAWVAARLRAEGSQFTAALPSREEWIAASSSADGRTYVFGDRFIPSWVKSCYARAEPGLEPVQTYPVDESPWGISDMAGGVAEWIDAWYDAPGGTRAAAGGSWAWARPEMFRTHATLGVPAHVPGDEFGIRLVLRRERTAK